MAPQFRRRHSFFKSCIKANGMYLFPDVKDMTPDEIDKEIKLRVAALQRMGKLPRVETEQKPYAVVDSGKKKNKFIRGLSKFFS